MSHSRRDSPGEAWEGLSNCVFLTHFSQEGKSDILGANSPKDSIDQRPLLNNNPQLNKTYFRSCFSRDLE